MPWSEIVFNLEWFLLATAAVMEIETSYGSYWTQFDRSGYYAIIGSFVWSSMVIARAVLGDV